MRPPTLTTLSLGPLLTLRHGAYEATISPSAGARVTQLLWHGNGPPLDCLVPAPEINHFNAFDWPKFGAFPMLPFSNRLKLGCFTWQGQQVQVLTQPHQVHGLHGFGHRSVWHVASHSTSAVVLTLSHTKANNEWPWPFDAELTYGLGDEGLQVTLRITNVSGSAMPASLGWHPFIPRHLSDTRVLSTLTVTCQQRHDVGDKGLNRIMRSTPTARRDDFSIPLTHAHTTAVENWSGQITCPLTHDMHLRLRSDDAKHLLIHVPESRHFCCIEPITSLPGALLHDSEADKRECLRLPASATRQLRCTLGLLSSPRSG